MSRQPNPDLPSGAGPHFSCPQPAGSLTAGPQPAGALSGGHLASLGGGLKSLLQLNMKADQRLKGPCEGKEKERLDLDEDSLGVCSMRSGSGLSSSGSSCGGGGGGGAFNQFLGPLLWERTLPADGGLFQLQYMDLEEFLTENGMGSMNGSSSSAQIPSQSPQSAAVPHQSSQCLPPSSSSSSPPRSSSPSSTTSSSSSSSSPSLLGLGGGQQTSGLSGGIDCLHGSQTSMNTSCESPCSSSSSSSSSSCPPLLTPTDSGPDAIGMFDMDSPDMDESDMSNQPDFDPRRHSFSEEELKPQPMIKKARKVLVPDNLKDEKYWSRRYKNNEAAKRSRDARRLKENQITVRAAYLERENGALRQEVAEMRKELLRCRSILSKYENRLADQ